MQFSSDGLLVAIGRSAAAMLGRVGVAAPPLAEASGALPFANYVTAAGLLPSAEPTSSSNEVTPGLPAPAAGVERPPFAVVGTVDGEAGPTATLPEPAVSATSSTPRTKTSLGGSALERVHGRVSVSGASPMARQVGNVDRAGAVHDETVASPCGTMSPLPTIAPPSPEEAAGSSLASRGRSGPTGGMLGIVPAFPPAAMEPDEPAGAVPAADAGRVAGDPPRTARPTIFALRNAQLSVAPEIRSLSTKQGQDTWSMPLPAITSVDKAHPPADQSVAATEPSNAPIASPDRSPVVSGNAGWERPMLSGEIGATVIASRTTDAVPQVPTDRVRPGVTVDAGQLGANRSSVTASSEPTDPGGERVRGARGSPIPHVAGDGPALQTVRQMPAHEPETSNPFKAQAGESPSASIQKPSEMNPSASRTGQLPVRIEKATSDPSRTVQPVAAVPFVGAAPHLDAAPSFAGKAQHGDGLVHKAVGGVQPSPPARLQQRDPLFAMGTASGRVDEAQGSKSTTGEALSARAQAVESGVGTASAPFPDPVESVGGLPSPAPAIRRSATGNKLFNVAATPISGEYTKFVEMPTSSAGAPSRPSPPDASSKTAGAETVTEWPASVRTGTPPMASRVNLPGELFDRPQTPELMVRTSAVAPSPAAPDPNVSTVLVSSSDSVADVSEEARVVPTGGADLAHAAPVKGDVGSSDPEEPLRVQPASAPPVSLAPSSTFERDDHGQPAFGVGASAALTGTGRPGAPPVEIVSLLHVAHPALAAAAPQADMTNAMTPTAAAPAASERPVVRASLQPAIQAREAVQFPASGSSVVRPTRAGSVSAEQPAIPVSSLRPGPRRAAEAAKSLPQGQSADALPAPSGPLPVLAAPVAEAAPAAASPFSVMAGNGGGVPVAFDTQQVSQPLVRLLGQSGGGSVSVRLQPAGLGTVDIRVDRGAGGTTRVTLRAQQPETASALGRQRAAVEAALDRAGIRPSQRILVIERDPTIISAPTATPTHAPPAAATAATSAHNHPQSALAPDARTPSGAPSLEQGSTGEAALSGGGGHQGGQPQGWATGQGRTVRHYDGALPPDLAGPHAVRVGAGNLASATAVDITA